MAEDLYKHKIRVRVCGLLIHDEKILLLQLKSPVTNALVWMPPGGGLQFGEKMHTCLRREFQEETGLQIETDHFVAVNELVEPPFHAIECYFSVYKTAGNLMPGKDPEQGEKDQIIKDVQWISLNEIGNISTAPKELNKWIQAGL